MTKELAVQILRGEVLGTNEQTHEAVFMAISALKNEQKQGKWELVDEAEPRRYGCSECKRLSYTQDNYCSYCGAKMKKRSFLINWSESEGYCDYE